MPDKIAKWLFYAVCASFFVCLLSGCRSARVVEVERVTHDTLSLTKVVNFRDTVFQHDSIVVTEQGTDRWHTRYVTKWRERTDTTYVSRTDTVPAPYKVETVREVPRKLSWWQNMLQYAGGLFFPLMLVGGHIIVRRLKKTP